MSVKLELLVTLQVVDSSADADAVPQTYRVEKEIASKQNVFPGRRQLATGNTLTLWDATTFAVPASFAFLMLWSDTQVEVELTTGEGQVTEELFDFALSPNVPFMLGLDDSRRNHSASDAFAGTLDNVNKIRVKNASGQTATLNWIFAE